MKSTSAMRGLVTISLASATSMAMAEPFLPGEGRSRKPARPYTPKTPTTEADFERLRLAEQKRARKAARQAKGMRA